MEITLDTILSIIGILGVLVTAGFGWYKFHKAEDHIIEAKKHSDHSSLVIELEKELELFRTRLVACEQQAIECRKEMDELKEENRLLMRENIMGRREKK